MKLEKLLSFQDTFTKIGGHLPLNLPHRLAKTKFKFCVCVSVGWTLTRLHARTESAGAVIRDCHFHDAYDGVMQLRSPGAIVSGNLFERAHTMQVATAKSWLEGAAGLEGIAVTDNVFRACCTPKVKAAEAEAEARAEAEAKARAEAEAKAEAERLKASLIAEDQTHKVLALTPRPLAS